MQPNLALAKKLNIGAIIISVIVLALVAGLRPADKPDFGIDFSFLPPIYSTLNAIVAFCLLRALIMIKKKNMVAHQRYIYISMALSALFLILYVIYHFTTPETKYCGVGSIRNVYFFILITHIVLAALTLPFILFTFIRAYTGQYEAHRKMAKIVWPFWFYVAVTGPVIYLMLRPCYGG